LELLGASVEPRCPIFSAVAANWGAALSNEIVNFNFQMQQNQRIKKQRSAATPGKPKKNQAWPAAGQWSWDAPLGTHVGRFSTWRLEFELQAAEIEAKLRKVKNVKKNQKWKYIVQKPQQRKAKTRMCHHQPDVAQHRYCGTTFADLAETASKAR
jgi:hypothetical protein